MHFVETPAAFWPAQELRRRSPWFAVPGFSVERIHWDLMHILFVKGVACDLVASSLVQLAEEGSFGNPGRRPLALDRAYEEFRGWLKLHRVCCSCPRFDEALVSRRCASRILRAR